MTLMKTSTLRNERLRVDEEILPLSSYMTVTGVSQPRNC